MRVPTFTLLAALLLPTNAGAESPAPTAQSEAPAKLWRRSWPTFSWVEGGATIAAGVGTLVLALQPMPSKPRWQGGILFDDSVRDALRLESAQARQRARSIGDLPYYAAPAIPLLIDPLLVAWGLHGDPQAARNLGFIGLEAFSYSGLLSFVSTEISRRERPDSGECRRQHPDGVGCGMDTEAFWSGHTSIAATSAGLVCAHHRYLPLWGHPVADAAACVWASSAALASGVSRLLSDRHYASDVIVGMGMGFGIGYAVPVLLHYTRTERTVALAPCGGSCLALAGSF